jgi:nucleoside-diphosphate-sugar epimerase
MKIAVTGGSGRVGSAVVAEALLRGHQVVSIDRVLPEMGEESGVRFVAADVTDYDALRDAMRGCEGLIHLAAIPSPGNHPDHVVHNNNVTGSYNALRAALENGIEAICQASSVNAIGLSYSRRSHFDYLPIDEAHPNYDEDPYSLSKWICEQQGNAFVRLSSSLRIASMRFHWVVDRRETAAARYNLDRNAPSKADKHLFGYTTFDMAARACLNSLDAPFQGHEAFYIAGADSTLDEPSRTVAAELFPDLPIRGAFAGNASFFDSAKARALLGI